MVNMNDLPPGTRVVWVRDDPVRGRYGVPEPYRNFVGTIESSYSPDRDLRDRGVAVYRVRFNRDTIWYFISTMIDLEEGPW